ncbi:MAG: prolipoprotein diacylglyceryl transferase family protein [Aggregatilineaceae bacterium]
MFWHIGPLTLRTYNAWLLGGALAALLVIGWRASRYPEGHVRAWLDVSLGTALAGLVGARGLYVLLQWEQFRADPDRIARLSSGGTAWHGGVVGGVLAALLIARWRRVPFCAWTDAAALAWPLLLATAWASCRAAGCAYGHEVATLADWPSWLVEELPDAYGFVAPRLDVQAGGVLLAALLGLIAVMLTWRGWLPGVRLWLLLALTGLGQALLSFLRADTPDTLYGQRADRLFDLALLGASTLIGGALWLADRRVQKRAGRPNAL